MKRKKTFIMMESRLGYVFNAKDDQYKVLESFKGATLKDKKYQPIFPYFSHYKSKEPGQGAFRVMVDTYVTEDSGTGIVHQVIKNKHPSKLIFFQVTF